MNSLEYPYTEMLDALKYVEGFADFEVFIAQRLDSDQSAVKAEIKALFELHNNRYLKSICSQGVSEPEAIIEVVQGVNTYQGIVEVAFLNYLFDTPHDTKKLINTATGGMKKGEEFHNQEKQIHIYKQEYGTLIFGKNVDLRAKALRIYKAKRKQHKERYPDKPSFLKVYYFVIDCPPTRLHEVGIREYLDRHLSPGEVLFICGIAVGENQKFMQSIELAAKGVEIKFDNPYFVPFEFPAS